MRCRRPLRYVAWLTLVAFSLSCATTRLPPISATGAAFQPERDERQLWDSARDEETKLLSKAKLYDDPILVAYLQVIVLRLNPAAMASNPEIGFRVRVVEDPTLNAFAYPHGSLYVHTGLLARMENEDQLATVLGHEMSHVEDRHMLRYQRSAQNRQVGFTIAALVAAVVMAGQQGKAWEQGHYGRAAAYGVFSQILIGLGLQLAFLASVNGYGRELEREADVGGFDKMLAAGYDTREAPRVYELLQEEHGDSGKAEAFFFGSHPRLAERIASANEWSRSRPTPPPQPAPAERGDAFERRMRTVVRDDAALNIDMGRLELADFQLGRALRTLPDDPRARFLLGRLKLKQAEARRGEDRARLEAEAREALGEAVRLDPQFAAAQRELGLLAFRHKDEAAACDAFRRYLDLAPAAEDASRIRDYVLELERAGSCPSR